MTQELAGIYQDDFFDNSKTDTIKDFLASPATVGQNSVVVNNGALFSIGKMVIIYDGVATFETATIQGKSGNTLTLSQNLVNAYPEGSLVGKFIGFLDTANKKYQRMISPDLGTGSDGAFVSSGDATWNVNKNFTSIQIMNGHTITISGNIQIKSQGDIVIDTGGKLSAKGQGHGGGGGWGQQGASYGGSGNQNRTPNGGGGGGGFGSGTGACGGGGGGYATIGADGGYQSPSSYSERGQSGLTYNNPQLSNNFAMEYLYGSGGGGGGAALESPSGNGGAGGGIIRLHCRNLTVNGEIDCDGATGQTSANANNYNRGGGGGGSGGTIFLQVLNKAVLGSGKVHANGGAGGYGRNTSSNNNAYGGSGGSGRIRLECSGRITGATSPGYQIGYNNNVGGFTKYGWYFSKEIKTYSPVITVNVFIKQEAIIKKNPSAVINSGQSVIALSSASDFDAGDMVIVAENEKLEIKQLLSIDGNNLVCADNFSNSYTTSSEIIRIDVAGQVCLVPAGVNEGLEDMVLQFVKFLGSNIWYLTFSKTIKSINADPSGMKLIGGIRLKGKSNDVIDVNIKEANWNYY